MNVVVSPALRLRKLTAADNPAIASVIRQVSAEYGLTADKAIPSPIPISTNCIKCIVSPVMPIG